MLDNQQIDQLRERIQRSLIQTKRDSLKEEFGLHDEQIGIQPDVPLEVQNEWLDYIFEFERQAAAAKTITPRERIGNPPLLPVAAIPPDELVVELEKLLDCLYEHHIVVEFLGDWEPRAAYQFLFTELLDEEMEDICIPGMFIHFTPTTVEYDLEMWVEMFVQALFGRDRKELLMGLEEMTFFDRTGRRMPLPALEEKLDQIWRLLPVTRRVEVEPLAVEAVDEVGWVTAVVSWFQGGDRRRVSSTFRLEPSPYYGWEVVQTSLLDDLPACY